MIQVTVNRRWGYRGTPVTDGELFDEDALNRVLAAVFVNILKSEQHQTIITDWREHGFDVSTVPSSKYTDTRLAFRLEGPDPILKRFMIMISSLSTLLPGLFTDKVLAQITQDAAVP